MRIDELIRCDALTFAKWAHLELHQSPLGNDEYLRLLACDVERIVFGEMPRYVCNLPPGHGKTFLFAVVLPAWILGHYPAARILLVSYGEDLATENCRKVREILRTSWFREAFPRTMLVKGQQPARDFATTAGGRVYARSIHGGTTGVRCEWLIIDDPTQIRDCGNLPHLVSVNAAFDNELINRLNNPNAGAIVIVQQRLNQSADLTAHVIKRKGLGFTQRKLALIAAEDHNYRLKDGFWHRKEGDVLRSDYSPDYIADLRENTGVPGFGPLYQQSFKGPDVLQVRPEDFVIRPFYAPPAVPYVLSVDLNHKGENGNSYSVVQCWGLLSHSEYVLYDQWRARANKSILVNQIRNMKSTYRPSAVLIEDNGPALDLQEQLDSPSCPVHLINARGDKLSRLRRHLPLFRTGRVVLRAGAPFNDELIAEFHGFPYHDHDDQVDSATQFFDWMQSNDIPIITHPKRAMGALGNARQARTMLYSNAGRPTRYVFSRR